MKIFRICFLALACIAPFFNPLLAQVDSINKATKPMFLEFNESDFYPGSINYQEFDSLNHVFYRYFIDNQPYTIVMASRKLRDNDWIYNEDLDQPGFKSGINRIDRFGYRRSLLKYYNTRAPLTRIEVIFGMKKEQCSKILHTQNITRDWNVAVNMLRIRSEGFYQRQEYTHNNMSATTNFNSRNHRYSFIASGYSSTAKSEESGGMQNDSLYLNVPDINKALIPVNISAAKSKRSGRGYYTEHFLNFGKSDSVMIDSTKRKVLDPVFSISAFAGAENELFVYTDTDTGSGFYDQTLVDSVLTHDSTILRDRFYGGALSGRLFGLLKIRAAYETKQHHFIQYMADSSLATDSTFNDGVFSFRTQLMPKSSPLIFEASLRYIAKGNYSGEHYISLLTGWQFNKDRSLTYQFSDSYQSVPFFYQSYYSNHFWWSNRMEKTSLNTNKIILQDRKLKMILGAEYSSITNMAYLDSLLLPQQFDSTANLIAITFNNWFRVGHFHLDNNIRWQSSSDSVISLPKWVLRHALYYKGRWFKKASEVRIGFELNYFSGYYGDAYMPALGKFYQQRSLLVGNYPCLDFFFGMKVRQTQIFFKTEHLNSGMSGPYYLSQNYPAPDRSIKVGVIWNFFD